jgi:hypothetical protein
MPLTISIDLSDDDLDHFREVMRSAQSRSLDLDEAEIIDNASRLMLQVRHGSPSEFVQRKLSGLETMIGMLVDEGWNMEEEDRIRVRQALAYFSEPEDLIPDDIPGIGYIDDAIMIELVTRELEHEIQAYRDFCVFRAAESGRLGGEAGELERADWLKQRRKELHSRMRRRRRRGRSGGGGGGSPFSLLNRAT